MLRTSTLAAGVLIALSALLYAAGDGDFKAAATLLAVTGLFLGLRYQAAWPPAARAAFTAVVAAAGAGFALETLWRIGRNLRRLHEWDYVGFWLHARTAVLGRNFYDPANAAALAAPFHLSHEFRREIVDVGFWYPPPSMFLFWPLGLADPMTALPAWYALQVLAAGVSVVLLRRLFFPGGGVLETVACAFLVCATHGTYETFYFSQTNFIALLALLMLWSRRTTASGGAWLAVAMFVKPLLALVAAAPALARRGRVMSGFAIATAGLLLVSALAFGTGTFTAYFHADRAHAKPDWIYSQPSNQSLLGFVLRTTGAACHGLRCIANPVFLAGAVALAAITLILAAGLERAAEDEAALALLLLLALLVYPVSQFFYTVLLIPPALWVWRDRDRMPIGAWTTAILLGLVFALAALVRGRASVLAYLLMWAILAWTAWRLISGRRASLAGIPVPPRAIHVDPV